MDTSLVISLIISVPAIVISLLSLWYSKTQSDSAKAEVELHKKELNASNERLLVEEKRNHYRRLIDESMQYWEYTPCSGSEMISY